MNEQKILEMATERVNLLKEKGHTLGIAESCTGGWLSKIITDISGVSAIYKGGVCSYSNEIKMSILGVKEETLASYGAVSRQTATEMAEGVRRALNTHIGIGITGIAGPLSDNTLKPVGLIYVAVSDGSETLVRELRNSFTEDIRTNNRLSAMENAIDLLGDLYEEK